MSASEPSLTRARLPGSYRPHALRRSRNIAQWATFQAVPDRFDPSTAAYAQAFACAPIGMALIGLDTRFREVNDAFCKFVGRPREELIGASFDSVTHPEDVGADMAQAIEVVRGDRDLLKREKRYLRPDGSMRWGEVGGSLIRDDRGVPV